MKQLLTMDAALGAVEDAFLSVASGDAVNMPRQRGVMPEATLNVLAALSRKLDAAVLKSYPVIRRDVTVGSSLTLLLYRLSTGSLEAIMEASLLGQVRTGAASGVAAKYMARPDSRVMTLFGAGFQAQSQVEALTRVLPNARAGQRRQPIAGASEAVLRRRDGCRRCRSRSYARISSRRLRRRTWSPRPPARTSRFLTAPGCGPGCMSMRSGSNYAQKRELDTLAVRRASRIVVDDIAVAKIESGDLIDRDLDWSAIRPLSDVVAGRAPGRAARDEITLFESQGIGLEDLAVACHVLRRARESGCGIEIPIR